MSYKLSLFILHLFCLHTTYLIECSNHKKNKKITFESNSKNKKTNSENNNAMILTINDKALVKELTKNNIVNKSRRIDSTFLYGTNLNMETSLPRAALAVSTNIADNNALSLESTITTRPLDILLANISLLLNENLYKNIAEEACQLAMEAGIKNEMLSIEEILNILKTRHPEFNHAVLNEYIRNTDNQFLEYLCTKQYQEGIAYSSNQKNNLDQKSYHQSTDSNRAISHQEKVESLYKEDNES